MQLVNCYRVDIAEADYFAIITRKTARLFALAAQVGGMIARASPAVMLALADYGCALGIAYQLIDDVLDYSQSHEQTGKAVGQDLAEGKMTLPLWYALHHSGKAECAILKRALTGTEGWHIEQIVQVIRATDALLYTRQRAAEYALKARQALIPIPASPYRAALEVLSEKVVERAY